MSKCRQNYHDETEAGINKQINIELFAHYSYLALVTIEITFFIAAVWSCLMSAVQTMLKPNDCVY